MEQNPSFPKKPSVQMGLSANNPSHPTATHQMPPTQNSIKAPTAQMPKSPQQANRPETSNSVAIRTMKSDLERLFQTTPPSVAQMITKPGFVNPAVKKAHQNARVYVILGVISLLLMIAGTGVYYFWDNLFPHPKPIEIIKAVPPAPFFATESSRTIEISSTDRQKFVTLMADSMKEFERDGTIKRILVKLSDASGEHFITPTDFFNFYHIEPPVNLIKRLGANLMLAVYTSSSGTRLGLAAKTNDTNRALRDMLDWESSMRNDIKPLFFGIPLSPISLTFEDRSYHNIDWRYLKLSADTDIGIGYGVFPAKNVLIITTSKEFTETIIDRLFNAR